MKKINRFTAAIAALAFAVTLLPSASVSAAQATGTDQILVKVKANQDIASLAKKHGAEVKKSLGSAAGYKVLKVKAGKTEDVLAKLKADPNVESAELDEILYMNRTIPNDPAFPSQYHLPKIYAPEAWDYCKGASWVKIAVIDTGIDIQHPDLSAKIVPGYDFVNNDTNADDDQGHGTHLAGTAAASTNNALNGAGVDWYGRLMPVKVLSATGSGYTSDIIDGIYYAADNGAKVINLSLGGGSYNSTFQSAINYAWNKGAVIIAAAGSSANTSVQYPAAYNNVLSVASTTSTDAKSSFSSYGSWVDVAAPGTSIYSTKNGGGMTTMSGTSMATSVVSGVAGLVWGKLGSSATPQQVITKITSSADMITGTGTYWTYGRVNAYKACR